MGGRPFAFGLAFGLAAGFGLGLRVVFREVGLAGFLGEVGIGDLLSARARDLSQNGSSQNPNFNIDDCAATISYELQPCKWGSLGLGRTAFDIRRSTKMQDVNRMRASAHVMRL